MFMLLKSAEENHYMDVAGAMQRLVVAELVPWWILGSPVTSLETGDLRLMVLSQAPPAT